MSKSKKLTGITVDVLMYGILLVQMLYVFAGNTLHEILGIAFFLLMICHIVMKRNYFRSFFSGAKKPPARRFSDIVTLLLLLSIIALMVSSMGVSRLIFPWFRAVGSSDLHRYLATAVLTLAVLHGGMHGYIRAKKKLPAALLIAAGCGASIAVGLALVPYLNRHFRKVEIDPAQAVSGEPADWKGSKPLVVYFTRVGNTDFEENVDAVSGASLISTPQGLMGNTELLAEMIDDAIDCDVRAITLTGEKYPSGYGDTVSVAGKELREDSRPEIETIDVSSYDSLILVYPIWWGTVPMPVASFLENSDPRGKKIYLVATQGSSGFVSSTGDIRKMAPGAEVTEGLSIYCDDIPDSREMIGNWLSSAG